ncbi:hypothetical protein acdb102_12290 [Acidothermaceae bacterium B102]|nr:hypothetical protein acdb102_12290 [Acidothermaceae bacterium B102]
MPAIISGGLDVHQSPLPVDTSGVNVTPGASAGSVVLGGSPLGSVRAAFNDPSVDPRVRHARVGAALYLLAAVIGAATTPLMPSWVHHGVMWIVAATAALAALVQALLPWDRWPDRAIMVSTVLSLLLIGVGVGGFGHALLYYLPLYALPFGFVGVTQRPGTSLALAPLALAAGTAEMFSGSHGFLFVPLLIMVGVSTTLGELISRSVRMQRIASDTLDELLMSVAGLTGCQSVAEATDLSAAVTARLVGADFVVVVVPEGPDSTRFLYAGGVGMPDEANEAGRGVVVVDTATTPSGTGIAALQRRMIFVPDARTSPLVMRSFVEDNHVASALFLPLTGKPGSVSGIAIAGFLKPRRAIDTITIRGLNLLAEATGRVVDQLRQAERLAKDADTDPLTGLANRRVFFRELPSLQHGDAVVFLDLDHFKDLNDTLGHVAGDRELATFGGVLREHVREGDVVARYGGEEFAVIVRGSGRLGAALLVNRLRDDWALHSEVTFSAGAALHEEDALPGLTLAAADRAVYAAKDAGRDRLCWADGPETYGPTVRVSTFGDPAGTRYRRDTESA